MALPDFSSISRRVFGSLAVLLILTILFDPAHAGCPLYNGEKDESDILIRHGFGVAFDKEKEISPSDKECVDINWFNHTWFKAKAWWEVLLSLQKLLNLKKEVFETAAYYELVFINHGTEVKKEEPDFAGVLLTAFLCEAFVHRKATLIEVTARLMKDDANIAALNKFLDDLLAITPKIDAHMRDPRQDISSDMEKLRKDFQKIVETPEKITNERWVDKALKVCFDKHLQKSFLRPRQSTVTKAQFSAVQASPSLSGSQQPSRPKLAKAQRSASPSRAVLG